MSADDAGSVATREPRVRRGWIRNAPIRRKLAMIVTVPLATALVLAALQVAHTGGQAFSAAQLRKLVTLSSRSAALADALQHERAIAVRALLAGDPGYAASVATTDRAVREYRSTVKTASAPAALSQQLDDIDNRLGTLPGLRNQVRHAGQLGADQRHSVPSAVALRYDVIISSLNSYRQSVAQNTDVATSSNAIRAAALFSQAKQDVAYEQTIAYVGLESGSFGADDRETFLTALHGQQQALTEFLDSATPAQVSLVRSTVAGDAVELASRLTAQLSQTGGGASAVSADDAYNSLGALADLMRWVETQLDSQVNTTVEAYEQQVVQQAGIQVGAIALAVLLAMLLVVAMARRMSQSLSDLRERADVVAGRDLPQAVARLADPNVARNNTPADLTSAAYRPIPITSTDEIGRVAGAFNGVQREAIRIAVEQAMLRSNVSQTFISVARRSQKLVDRLIASLDRVERDEDQPERLQQLFELDHLATQMRRNDENLLILADADAASPRMEDAALADVLAAAQSEIARFERIQIGSLNLDAGPGEAIMVRAAAVNDVVRLFAELLENAANYSPPDRQVQVTGRRVGDQHLIEIEDHGIGMSQDRRDELNGRLARPGENALGAVRMMGFAIVARLAARHHMRVHLGAGRYGGTVAHVVLPTTLLVRQTAKPLPYNGSAWTPAASQSPSVGQPPSAALPQQSRHPAPDGMPNAVPTPIVPRSTGSAPVVPMPPAMPPAEPVTASIPVVPPAIVPPLLGNEWFHSSTVRADDAAGAERPAEPPWQDQHDGWRAAQRAARPEVTEQTSQGLPRRAPMAQLVPGGFGRERTTEIARTATAVRSFLTEYQRGVSSGRHRAASNPAGPDTPDHHYPES